MCKLHICGTRYISLKHGDAPINRRGYAMFLSSCKKQLTESRDTTLMAKERGHVFSSNVLKDERVINIHVSFPFLMAS